MREIQMADGRRITLRYDANALASVEDVLGRPITAITEAAMGLRELRALVWAGSGGAYATVQEAGAAIPLDRLTEVAGAVGEAIASAFGDEGQTKKKAASAT